MLATTLHKGPVLGKKGLPPIGHSDTPNRPSSLGRCARKVILCTRLAQRTHLGGIVPMNRRGIGDTAAKPKTQKQKNQFVHDGIPIKTNR